MALKYQRVWILRYSEDGLDNILWAFATRAEAWKKLVAIVRAQWEVNKGETGTRPVDPEEMVREFFETAYKETYEIKEVY